VVGGVVLGGLVVGGAVVGGVVVVVGDDAVAEGVVTGGGVVLEVVLELELVSCRRGGAVVGGPAGWGT